jgi:hypothetical protein
MGPVTGLVYRRVPPTGPDVGTSFWVPQLNRFYVAVPANEKQEAAVLVFEPEP